MQELQRFPRRARPVALAATLLCLLASGVAAQPITTLREVVVSGSRSEQFSDELPVSNDVVGEREIERQQIQDIRDLARDLPNVSVRHAPSRFAVTGPANSTGRDGNAGFNIRGLGGNRVLMMVDGIRLPRSYAFGGNAFGRDSLALDLVKRVEVVRGAGSALYGSDAMGGLVHFITYEPADFLATPEGTRKAIGGRIAAGWSGDDHGRSLAGTVAARAGDSAEWMLTASARRAHALENKGGVDTPDVNRTTPNPQQDRDDALLAKVVLRPTGAQRHVLAFERVERQSEVNLLSSRAVRPLTGSAATIASAVLDERGSMDMVRNRLTWDGRWRVDTLLADQVQAVIGLQDAASRQLGSSDLNTRPDRFRDVRYEERTWQAGLQAQRSSALGEGWGRTVTYGVDFTRAKITNLYTGINSLPPEVFPLKRFPDTRETTAALYGQAEWASDRWSLVPGLRYDRFELDVLSQDLFFPPAARPARSLSGSALSPKLGVLFRATPAWSVFGSYAGGFRAPNANQINGYYENSAEFVQVVPNPDLQPEKSRTLEFGLRGRLPGFELDAAVFTGRYSNLIVDNVLLSGTGVAGDPKLFQTRNIERARIHGFELKGHAGLGNALGGAWITHFAHGQARGTNSTTGRPLNSIDPAQASLGLEYRRASWDLRLDARHREAKPAEDIDSGGLVKPPNTQFTVPAATTFDLSAQWRIRPGLRLTGSVVNFTDRKYWVWADVQGLAASTRVADAYTQPGRHLKISLVADF